MAIFIALIFQVLFVFFAMIVNVGLIVHDKINLQNSVDLAAYYAAQRQAELLNAIAHQNYQIRQAWKLLSWRLRVIGDLGYSKHPMQTEFNQALLDQPAFSQGAGGWRPTVCVVHTLWGSDQNLCKSENITIPALPPGMVIASFGVLGPINVAAAMQTDNLRQAAGADCSKAGPLNFNLAVIWVTAYRHQVAKSKELIRKYADMLSENAYDLKDVNGKNVKQGSLKTLEHNLTRANYKALIADGESGFRFYNSLGALGDRQKWLNEVPIYPSVFYTDFQKDGAGVCKGKALPINGEGEENKPYHMSSLSRDINTMRNEPRDIYDLYHSVYGVEKNPWAMAYIGIYAETKPRKPYLPFGDPITLKAKAFAKPFGGRIGPWFFSKWPRESNRSAGNSNDKIDSRMPLPMDGTGTNFPSNSEQELSVPNYSRFPGDQMGLLSKLALAAFKDDIKSNFDKKTPLNPAFYSGTPTNGDGLAMVSPNATGGVSQMMLGLGYNGPWVRDYEVAAIAPDLFDATYYSIDVNAYKNYTEKSVEGRLITPENAPFDIGSNGLRDNKTIEDQINLAKSLSKNTFWTIKNPHHLLNAWAPSGAYKYDFPSEAFGRCEDANTKIPIPGMCARGGRVGYSVKIVSEDYLKSTELALGGDGSKGPLVNPPPANF